MLIATGKKSGFVFAANGMKQLSLERARFKMDQEPLAVVEWQEFHPRTNQPIKVQEFEA